MRSRQTWLTLSLSPLIAFVSRLPVLAAASVAGLRWLVTIAGSGMVPEGIDDKPEPFILQGVLGCFLVRGHSNQPEGQTAQQVDARPFRDLPGCVDFVGERLQHRDEFARSCAKPVVAVVAERPVDQPAMFLGQCAERRAELAGVDIPALWSILRHFPSQSRLDSVCRGTDSPLCSSQHLSWASWLAAGMDQYEDLAWTSTANLRAMSGDDGLWQSYLDTAVHFGFSRPGGTVIPDPRGVANEPPFGPLQVVTAIQPGADPDSVESRTRMRILEHELDVGGIRSIRAVGSALDGSHGERSLAVFGVTVEEALALGRRFGQVAIFDWEGPGWSLLACVGDRRTDRGWRWVADSAH